MISKYESASTNKFGKSIRPSLGKTSPFPGPGQRTFPWYLDDIISENFGESLYDKAYTSKFGGGKRKSLGEQTVPTPGPGT